MTTIEINGEGGSGAAAFILALVIVALVGLGVWFFTGQNTTITKNVTNIEAPAAPSAPTPPLPAAPSSSPSQ